MLLYTLWRTGTPREIAFALFHWSGGERDCRDQNIAAALAIARAFRWPLFGWRMVLAAIISAPLTPFSANG